MGLLCHGNLGVMHLDFSVYTTPMRTKFRGITSRDGLLVRGASGWGEVSPFWDYDAEESSNWLRAGIEAAEFGFPTPVRSRIPVNVTVPAVDAQKAHAIASRGTCHTAKVKIAEPGQTLADDLARLEAVRDALGPQAKIRVDVNGKWSAEHAIATIPQLDRAAGGLEYVEQPCATVEELAAVRRAVDVRIAADESIRRAEDPYEVRRQEAADLVVVKNQPLGGVRRALEIAEQIDLPVVVSSALESSVGIRAGLAFAAALPELEFACGLATVQLFEQDVTTDSLLPIDGFIEVRDVEPDALLGGETEGPDFELVDRWSARLEAMWANLESLGHVSSSDSYQLHRGY